MSRNVVLIRCNVLRPRRVPRASESFDVLVGGECLIGVAVSVSVIYFLVIISIKLD